MHNTSRVLLPLWVFKDNSRKEVIEEHLKDYMKRYPEYVVLEVKNGFAICNTGG